MKILYISQDGTAPSGISTYGFHVLLALPDAQMLLLNASRPPSAAPSQVLDRIHCVREEASHDVGLVAQRIAELTERMQGEVLVLPNTGDTPWAATVAWLRNLPVAARERFRILGIVHSDVETQYAGAVRHDQLAGAWIGVSRRCADVLQDRFKGTNRCVHTLNYPMAVGPATASKNDSAPLRLIYAGRLEEPQKCVSRLAAVVTRLVDDGVGFSMTIAGDGPARAELEAGVSLSGAASSVTFLGAVSRDELQALLLANDVFVLTSAFEGLPLALLEAMASGLCPVVMNTKSGTEDVLHDGVNACVVPQGDVPAMAAAIARLAGDRNRLSRMKAEARGTIAREFQPAGHFRRLGQIANECFAAPGPDLESVGDDPTARAVSELVAQAQATGGPVAVYGAGMFGRKVVDACLDSGLRVAAMLDSDPSRAGKVYRGIPCGGPEAVRQLSVAAFIVGSLEFATPISERIRELISPENPLAPRVIAYHG